MSEVQVSFVFVQDELVKALMAYLEGRPLKEAKNLYDALAWSQSNQKQLADNIRNRWITEADEQKHTATIEAVKDPKIAKMPNAPKSVTEDF